MIPFSPAAERQLADLIDHYVRLERAEAVENLRIAVQKAARRIGSPDEAYLNAPRPYPELSRLGFRWLKEGRYWFGYRHDADGQRFYAVFHQTADIAKRAE